VLKTSGVNQILKRLARRAGITGRFNPHSFRHAFAKQYLMDGGDLATLSDLLGHSDVQVTKSSYSVFITDELARKHAEHSPVAKLIGG
jgi:integrase/recombinase XerD